MKNCDFSRSDLAAAHGRHGKKLRLNLERAQGELDRREAILQRSPSGKIYDAAWAGFMDRFVAVEDAKMALRQDGFHVPG